MYLVLGEDWTEFFFQEVSCGGDCNEWTIHTVVLGKDCRAADIVIKFESVHGLMCVQDLYLHVCPCKYSREPYWRYCLEVSHVSNDQHMLVENIRKQPGVAT